MEINKIKQNLFHSKVDPIMNSEFAFLYRETIDFILEKHQLFQSKISNPETLKFMLPIACQSDFVIQNTDETEIHLNNKIENIITTETPKSNKMKIIQYPEPEENKLLFLILLRYSQLNSDQILEKIPLLTLEQKEIIFQHYFKTDPNLKMFDFLPYTIELTADIPTLQKIKKLNPHKTIVQPFSIHHNYYTPPQLLHSGHHGEYIMVMKKALNAYQTMLPHLSTKAFYIIPLAFMQKVIFTISINKLKTWDFPFVEELLQQIKIVNPTIYQGISRK